LGEKQKKGGIMTALRICFALLVLSSSTSANAFRSLNVESYTDPDYQGYQPKKVVLLVANATNDMRTQIESRMVSVLGKRGLVVIPYRDLFPPTRQWSAEEQAAAFVREGVDSGLIVTVGASAASVIPVATQTYSSATVFGSYGTNGTFDANVSGISTTHNVLLQKSTAEFSAVLLDVARNRTIWYADVTTNAGGSLFVGTKGDSKALVNGVLRGLEEKGHVLPKDSRKSER
jgi:hypothetical protein